MIRWKKQEKESRLASIGSPPRGSYLYDGDEIVASVKAVGGSFITGPLRGWSYLVWSPVRIDDKTIFETQEAAKKVAGEVYRTLIKSVVK